MAFRPNLKFEGKEYDVLQCTYSFHRDVDLKGRPSSNVYGGTINVEVESTEDTAIVAQMVNQFKPNSGTITFNKGDEEAKMKELSWENGYVIRYTEERTVLRHVFHQEIGYGTKLERFLDILSFLVFKFNIDRGLVVIEYILYGCQTFNFFGMNRIIRS